MDFRTLRAFVEVIRQGSFSRAADIVCATQSTVSKAVRQLEEEIGEPLIDRSAPMLRLTDLGEVVFPRAVQLLTDRNDLLAQIAETRGLKRGSLRLGLPPVASSTLFAPVLARYRRAYPDIDVRLVEHGGDRLMDLLQQGEIDLAATLAPHSDAFGWQMVRREPLVAVLAADFAQAQASSIGLTALADLPFILFTDGFGINRLILAACRRHGIEPVVAARSAQLDFQIELAADRMGVAFLPRDLVERKGDPRVAAVLLAEPDTEWQLAMVWRHGVHLSHAARAWLAMVHPPGSA